MSTHATVLTLISILSLLSRCALICKDSSEIKTVRDQTKKEPKPGNTPDLSPFADVIPSDLNSCRASQLFKISVIVYLHTIRCKSQNSRKIPLISHSVCEIPLLTLRACWNIPSGIHRHHVRSVFPRLPPRQRATGRDAYLRP